MPTTTTNTATAAAAAGPATQPGRQPSEATLYDEKHEEYERAESDVSAPEPAKTLAEEEGLTKVKSKASVNDVAAVPNGGVMAWLQVVGAFFIMFNSWGIINTFGAYQTYYETPGSIFVESSSTISWIGSIQAFLLLVVGALTGPVYDAGYFRSLLIVGSFLIVFGHMMLSLCHAYWQALLAQAFCIGIGCGCLFIPGVAIISTYFTTKLPAAMGLVASGSSLGGVLYPIIFYRLVPQVGFGWTVRIIGFIVLATQSVSCVVLKMRVKPASKRKLFDIKAFTELPYLSFVLGGLVGFCGLYVPFFYIQYYAISNKITDPELGFYLLAILNTGSVFGRIVPNIIAQRTGPWNMMIPCAFITSALIFALLGAHSKGSVIAIAVLYGFFSGTFVSIPPTMFVHLSPNRGMIGTRMGMGFTVFAIGVLIGTPIAGAILGDTDTTPGPELNWSGIWIFGAVLTLVGSVLFFVSRMSKAGGKFRVKV